MYNPFSLKDKNILVTGASSGIGRAIAIECSKMFGNVFITARNQDRLTDVYSNLHGDGHNIIIADLKDYNQITSLVEMLPGLDGVVCNAGVVKTIVTSISDAEDIKDIFSVNTFSHIQLMQLLLKKKKINREASVVFISSISGVYCGAVGGSLYGSTKAALNGFAKALALEVAPRGIRVNTVNPGVVETDIYKDSSLSKDSLDEDRKRYPLRRYGKPDEIAYSVVYLLSDATKWMTGSSILIDGGYTLR